MHITKKRTAVYGFLLVALCSQQQSLHAGWRDMLRIAQQKTFSTQGALTAWCAGMTLYCIKLQRAQKTMQKKLLEERDRQEEIMVKQQKDLLDLKNRLGFYAQSLTDFSLDVIHAQHTFDERLKSVEKFTKITPPAVALMVNTACRMGKGASLCKKSGDQNASKKVEEVVNIEKVVKGQASAPVTPQSGRNVQGGEACCIM
jgi:hypothetical protein